MDCSAFNDAVAFVRNGGLSPTLAHFTVAKLVLDQGEQASLEDLLDSAEDPPLGLSRETLAATIERFVRRGLIMLPMEK